MPNESNQKLKQHILRIILIVVILFACFSKSEVRAFFANIKSNFLKETVAKEMTVARADGDENNENINAENEKSQIKKENLEETEQKEKTDQTKKTELTDQTKQTEQVNQTNQTTTTEQQKNIEQSKLLNQTFKVSPNTSAAQKLSVAEASTFPVLRDEEGFLIDVATRSKIDKLIFVGDVYFSDKVKNAYDAKGLNGIMDNNYQFLFKTSDLNIGNLECAITDGTADEEKKQYNLFTPEKYISTMKEIGFNIFTLANNHTLDYGKNVLVDTMKKLESNDISYIGAGTNENEARKFYLKEIEGKKYAIFAASAVIPDENWKASETQAGVNNGYNIAEICKDIRDIRDRVDKIIVYMHWGDELSEFSNADQKKFAHKLVDFGADLVVGSHPHVVQEIEYYKNVPIVYSLGNFIYGSTSRETIMLEAFFNYADTPEGILQLRIEPGLSNYEMVRLYWQEEDFIAKCRAMQDKCDSCFVSDTGFIFTPEAVEEALRKVASESNVE